MPLLADYGHHLVGLYEVMMNDYEVCTVWATEPDADVRAAKARDIAWVGRRGRRKAWKEIRGSRSGTRTPATWCTRWREELMTPHVGTLCAPDVAPLDRQRARKPQSASVARSLVTCAHR